VSYWQTSVIMFIPVSHYFYFCSCVILSCKFLCILSFFCNCYVSLIIDFVLYLCKREGHNWLLFIRSFIVCLCTYRKFFLELWEGVCFARTNSRCGDVYWIWIQKFLWMLVNTPCSVDKHYMAPLQRVEFSECLLVNSLILCTPVFCGHHWIFGVGL